MLCCFQWGFFQHRTFTFHREQEGIWSPEAAIKLHQRREGGKQLGKGGGCLGAGGVSNPWGLRGDTPMSRPCSAQPQGCQQSREYPTWSCRPWIQPEAAPAGMSRASLARSRWRFPEPRGAGEHFQGEEEWGHLSPMRYLLTRNDAALWDLRNLQGFGSEEEAPPRPELKAKGVSLFPSPWSWATRLPCGSKDLEYGITRGCLWKGTRKKHIVVG